MLHGHLPTQAMSGPVFLRGPEKKSIFHGSDAPKGPLSQRRTRLAGWTLLDSPLPSLPRSRQSNVYLPLSAS